MVPDRVHELLDDICDLLSIVVEYPALARRSFARVDLPRLTPAERECLLALYVLGPSLVADVAAVIQRSDGAVRGAVVRLREYQPEHLALETPLDNGATRYELSQAGRRLAEAAWPEQRIKCLLCATYTNRLYAYGGRGAEGRLGPEHVYALQILLAVTCGYARPVAGLARELALDPASVSQGLGWLRERGLADVYGAPKDRRRHVVAVSPAGHEFVMQLLVGLAQISRKDPLR